MGDYVLQNWCMNESTILVKSPHPKLSFVATNSHADFHYKLIKIKTEFKKTLQSMWYSHNGALGEILL